MAEISPSDLAFLREAVAYLESPSYLMKLADAVGGPLQSIATRVVPQRVKAIGNRAIRNVMSVAADTVQRTAPAEDFAQACRASGRTGRWHRMAATATGGISGTLGFAGLAFEIPVTTGIMFRSIASIAHEFGEDLSTPEAKLECIAVFSHGGPSPDDDAMDASYITARVAMATLVRDAAEFMASKSTQAVAEALVQGTAPALVRFLSQVAAAFNVVISQKLLAQSVPMIGIATGAAINNAFAGHFNSVSRYHFGIRRLQRHYGSEPVLAEYQLQLGRIRGQIEQ